MSQGEQATWVCDALIFDLDGVLIDSDAIYERHWQQWATERGVSFRDILAVHHGRPAIETIRIVAPHLDGRRESEGFNDRLAADSDMRGLTAFDGVAELLERLPAPRWAIATSAPHDIAVTRLRFLGLPVPSVLIGIDNVAEGKPAPEPFLGAAAGLGCDPARCIVIEDAPAGVTAARAAGARVIAVSTTNSPDALDAADAVIARFADLDVTVTPAGLTVSRSREANPAP